MAFTPKFWKPGEFSDNTKIAIKKKNRIDLYCKIVINCLQKYTALLAEFRSTFCAILNAFYMYI